jgi:hypothetical protein
VTDQLDLDEIAARAAGLYEYATGLDDAWQAEADQLAGTDVPALVAEVRRLRAELTAEQAQHAFTLRQRNNRSERLNHLRDVAKSGQTELLIEDALNTMAASVTDHLPADTNEMAASLRRDGFGDDEIADMLGPGVTVGEPTLLRWSLDDVMWGDDDTITVLLSGPDREPYWLELDPARAAILRRNLAGPDGEQQDADDEAASV